MKKIRVAINGFGRIGRITYRALLSKPNIDVIAINDLTDTTTLAHLLKYDSIHGKFDGTISLEGDLLILNNHKIKVVSEKDPSKLPWKNLNVDVVIESTGKFADAEGAKLHLDAGAKKVVLSAPSKGKDDVKTIVPGVNEHLISRDEKIYSWTCGRVDFDDHRGIGDRYPQCQYPHYQPCRSFWSFGALSAAWTGGAF